LRALGHDDPPVAVQIDGQVFHRTEIYKHDSWAATALYTGQFKQVVCKFNRVSPLFGLPMTLVGHWLARHERQVLERLADVPNVPRFVGVVSANGRVLQHALARSYVAGHPLGRYEAVPDDFFPQLERLLARMHARGMAYVDLHKRENIIVGDDSQAYLVDFQISAALPSNRLWDNRLTRSILRIFQQSDVYHLLKHVSYNRPDLAGFGHKQMDHHRPWWIWLHRFVAIPPRVLRRVVLVLLGVRRGKGKPVTEHFAEDAIRRESQPLRRTA
jgi:hypothetical protein